MRYQAHIENLGWLGWTNEGEGRMSGTTGQHLRMEAFMVDDTPDVDGLEYRAHVRDLGWLPWVKPGEVAGTTGEGRRLEAVQMRFTNGGNIWYAIHSENYGWFPWSSNGETLGTTGERLQAEAIKITLTGPGVTDDAAKILEFKSQLVDDFSAKFYLQQNGKVYELAVKDGASITRETNKASCLKCTVLRDAITPEVGNIIAMKLNGVHNQFYGVILSTSKKGQDCAVTAYDQIFYMANCKDTMTYEDITANDLLLRIVKDYHLKTLDPPTMMNTQYKIPKRIEDNVSLLDMVCTALDLTYKNTGKHFYLWDDFGAISLCSEEWLAITTSRVSLGYIQDYSYDESMEDGANHVKLYTEDDTGGERRYFETERGDSINRYGYLQYFGKVEVNGLNWLEQANVILDEKSYPQASFSVSGMQGDIRVRGGSPIQVDFFTQDRSEYIKGWFRTDRVTHSFSGGLHTMDLELTRIGAMDTFDTEDNFRIND